MKAERWQQVERLFHGVVELEPARRAAFLNEACAGDQALRSDVESLLAADSREWNFIEKPAVELAAAMFDDHQPQLTSGQPIGHYQIVSLIGRGGMGEVYLATDQTLNRRIALKLLPLDYTKDKDRLRRFQREAQATSALNHPNILTIHQLGDVDGRQFIATEFIEGETLRKHLARGPLTLRSAVDVAIQTASALAAAHRAGIVHRDIKPENIMLRPDGYVKVLDFGLAKLAQDDEAQLQSKFADELDMSSGVLMGTVKYMSPEQARGLTVDARSDIFSLGVVLYEMIAGRAPFENKNAARLVESILKDKPPSLANYLHPLPDRIDAIIDKALTKERESRYQETESLLADLQLLKEELELETKLSRTEKRSSGRTAPLNEGSSLDRAEPTALSYFNLTFASKISRPRATMAIVGLLLFASLSGYATYNFIRRTGPNSGTLRPSTQSGAWTTKASISSPRYQAEPVVLNGVLYVVGGWNVCTPYANLESYDPASNTWTQRAPMLTARGSHGVGVLNGLLYAVGGSVGCGEDISSVEAYDPQTNTWFTRASLPTKRNGHVVAVANGKLYAIGGVSNQFGSSRLTTEYDPVTDKWIDRAPMPTSRNGAAAVVVNDIIYVIGGRYPFSDPSKTVEAYNPSTNVWTQKALMLVGRENFAACEINGTVYAFGGDGNSGQVEAYSPATDRWSTVAQMAVPRSNFHAAAFDGSIYFAGGFDGKNYLSSVVAFTPGVTSATSSNSCEPPGAWTTKAALPAAREMMAIGQVNGILYAVGGHDADGSAFFSRNEAYDPLADKWTEKAPMPTARALRGTNNAVVDGRLYVIGGNPRGECTNVNEAYDPATDTWTTRASMPTARCHVAVIALGPLIYAIGGNTNTAFTSIVEIYDSTRDEWTTAQAMPTARQDVAAGVIDGILYVVGGWNQYGSLNTLEVYDPTIKTWTTKASMPTPRQGLAAGVLNGSLIVVGGEKDHRSLAVVEAYDPSSDTWRSLPNMPTARGFLSAVTLNNMLYAFGGGSSTAANSFTSVNEVYISFPCSAERH